MKRNVRNLPLAVGLAVGAVRWLDVLFFTDMKTGLCTVGSVWLRYALLAFLGGIGFLAGQNTPDEGMKLKDSWPRMGRVSVAGGVVFLSVSVLTFLRCVTLGFVLARFLRGIFAVSCGLWLLALGMSWLHPKRPRSTGSAWGVVGGTILFYWLVLERFMGNRSSFHRVQPVAEIFESLVALLFLTALGRMLLFPEDSSRRIVCRTGWWAFYFCTCWGLSQFPAELLYGTDGSASLALCVGMAVIGVLGAICATEVSSDRRKE